MFFINAIAACSLFYELFKVFRDKTYHVNKKVRLVTSILSIGIGGLYMITFGVPFYLIASVVALLLILSEPKKTEPWGSVKCKI